MKKIIDNSLAVIGLLAVMSSPYTVPLIAKHFEKQPVVVARLEPRFLHPVQADATMCQRGPGEKWKCKIYIRSDK